MANRGMWDAMREATTLMRERDMLVEENPEYVAGMCDLIARLWPTHRTHSDRSGEFKKFLTYDLPLPSTPRKED